MDKFESGALPTPPPPPPPVEAVTEAVKAAVPAAAPVAASTGGSLPDFGDLPVIPIVLGVAAVAVGVSLLGGGGDESAAPAAASAPSSSSGLSIPYDAAARLAYDRAGKPGDYAAFKAKYEADAVAEVKAKQKK